jgi:alpha-L-rhamnosidase
MVQRERLQGGPNVGDPLTVETLRCNGRKNPLGIDGGPPRLSWTLSGPGRDRRQTAYQIQVAEQPDALVGGPWVFDSGVVPGSESDLPYTGPVAPRRRYYWHVRVFDEQGHPSPFSEPAWWETALDPDAWRAAWIAAPRALYREAEAHREGLSPATAVLSPPVVLRRRFTLPSAPTTARLYATALGTYVPFVNGERVGVRRLAPGWTDYRVRVLYQTYDVTESLRAGENVLGLALADGWYAGYVGFGAHRHHYGTEPWALCQLEVDCEDGTHVVVETDHHWRAAPGPWRYADLLMGEWFDARQVITGWDTPGYDDNAWWPVIAEVRREPRLVADPTEGITVTETLPVTAWHALDDGRWIADFGQNFAGVVRLSVAGPVGTVVRIRHGEMLNPDGTLYTENLRAAEATDTYVLAGHGRESFTPTFTYHGFRYTEVTGLPAPPDRDTLTGLVVHDALEPTGSFTCSAPLVNRLQHNIVFGQRSNFVSVPTDCPQRDERLGWMGDAQVFARTATFNYDVLPFFSKWLADVRDAQGANGAFSDVAPRLVDLADGAPGWGDAGIIVPWTLYQVYGDRSLLAAHYDAMQRWMQYLSEANPTGLWLNRRHNDFGDWLAPDPRTPKDLIATAFYAYDAAIMARVAAALGRDDDAALYRALFQRIREAFCAAYVGPDGFVAGNTQTAYVLALYMDLMPPADRPRAAARLVEDIARHDGHLTTGFLGLPYLLPVLSDAGYDDVAYHLLLNTSYPSWGYPIQHGATTIWERWDGWTAERGFQDPGMNSFNHYAFGAVGEWLYRYAAGIDADPDAPGFAHVRIQPRVTPRLEWVEARYASCRGPIAVNWRWANPTLVTVTVELPPNTTATVTLPAADPAAVAVDAPEAGIHRVERRAVGIAYEVGSGRYTWALRDVSPPSLPG